MKNIIILLVFFFGLITEITSQNTIMNIHQTNGNVTQIPLNEIDSITYTINPELPTLNTLNVNNIGPTSASSGGEIINDGGSNIIQRGICWSLNSSPTVTDNISSDGTGIGIFSSDMYSLTPNTTYFVRSYATNSVGTAYGNEISFNTTGNNWLNPGLTYGNVSDIDGNNYATITIGGQIWMAENLKTTHYSNGDPITFISDNFNWANVGSEAYCIPFDSNRVQDPYGLVYNWYTVNDVRNVCPTGFHVPSYNEFENLITFLGGSTLAGGAAKSTGTIENGDGYFTSPNTGATNSSGLSLVGGVIRGWTNGGEFYPLGIRGICWSSTEDDVANAFRFYVEDNSEVFGNISAAKGVGYSIRCISD